MSTLFQFNDTLIQYLLSQSPIQNDPWNGTLDATNDKNECLQLDSLIAGSVKGDEDCLYINVYTPGVSSFQFQKFD